MTKSFRGKSSGWLILAAIGAPVIAAILIYKGTSTALVADAGLAVNTLAAMILLFAASSAISQGWFGFALSSRNRYSLSRLQMGIWSAVVLGLLLSAAEWNLFVTGAPGPLSIAIPGPLLAALGISVFSGVAAPGALAIREAASSGATQLQIDSANARIDSAKPEPKAEQGNRNDQSDVVADRQVIANKNIAHASWRDFFTGEELANAGLIDLAKVQQALFSAVVISVYFVGAFGAFKSGVRITTLPELGDDAVRLLAISSAGYLAYKVVPKGPGPQS